MRKLRSEREVRGLNLAVLAVPIWAAAIAAPTIGVQATGLLALMGAVLLLVPDRVVRIHAAALLAAAAVLAASTAGLDAERRSVEAASAAPGIVRLEGRVESDPREARGVMGEQGRRPTSAPVDVTGSEVHVGNRSVPLPRGSHVIMTWDERTRTSASSMPVAGSRIAVRGRMEQRGSVIFVRALALEVVAAQGGKGRGRDEANTEKQGPLPAAGTAREVIIDRFGEAASFLPPDESALVRGMVVGDTAGLSDEVKEAMKTSGLTHLVAVSGANVLLVYAAVSTPLLLFGVRRRPRVIAAAGAIAAYVWLVGDEPSVLRAATMAIPLLISRFVGFRTPGIHALGLTVIVWSLWDPATSGSLGFVLSAVATAAILLASTPLAGIMCEFSKGRMPREFALAIAVPTVAQAACTPVLILLAPEVSVWAVPANMLAEVVVAPATLAGFAALVLSLAWAPLAWPFVAFSGCLAHVVVLIARAGQALPGAHIEVPGGAAGSAIAVLSLLLAGLVLWTRQYAVVKAAVCLALAVVLGVWGWGRAFAPAQGWDLALCDVGQGDSLVIRTRERSAIVVDTGPETRLLERCLNDLDVNRVDLLVLTHPHADHVGGVSALTGNRAPRAAWGCPLDQTSRNVLPAGVGLTFPLRGHHEQFGPVMVSVQWPRSAEEARVLGQREGASEESALNDCSLVLRIEGPEWTALLLGDLEPKAQEVLANEGVEEADIIKVAHHGSRRQHEPLYVEAKPRVALIGVGKNSFGHPHPRTLAMLEGGGAHVFRTDRDHTVRLQREADTWKVGRNG